jgi:hypothetical protein
LELSHILSSRTLDLEYAASLNFLHQCCLVGKLHNAAKKTKREPKNGKDICTACDENLDEQSNAMNCDTCKHWLCIDCFEISTPKYNLLSSDVEISTMDELSESLYTARSVSCTLSKQTVFMSVDSNHSSIIAVK